MIDGDHAVRALEHAAFGVTLIPAETDAALLSLLDAMCSLVSNGIHDTSVSWRRDGIWRASRIERISSASW
jgi:hypothetical protein